MIALHEYGPGAVREAIEACAGLKRLRPGDSVLIKPNLCLGGRIMRALPGATTSARVVEEIIGLLRDCGAGEITIGEGTVEVPSMGSFTGSAFRDGGYLDLARRYGVELVDFNAGPFTRRVFERRNMYIAKGALEHDFVVNAPCLKTHIMTQVSLGLKNMKGVLKLACKRYFHRHELHRLIAGLNTFMPTDLVVVDGQLAMEFGPDSDQVKQAGVVLAGTDLLEVDTIGSRLLGIEPSEVEHLREFAALRRRRLDARIEVRGLDVEAAATPCRWRIDDEEAELYHDLGVRGLSVAQDVPNTVCSGCRVALLSSLTRFAAHSADTDLSGVELIAGQNARCLGDALGLRVGDCAVKRELDPENEISVGGCPPDIHEVYHSLLRAQALRER